MLTFKKTFGRYFKELLELDDNVKNASIKLKIGGKTYKGEIESLLFLYIKLPLRFYEFLGKKKISESITYDEFMYMFDGVPVPQAEGLFIKQFLDWNIKYTEKEIKEWNAALFSDLGKECIEYLKDVKGLSESTIKDNQLGFDEESNSIVFPFFNFTKASLINVKFFPLDNIANQSNCGLGGLFGFHELVSNEYKNGQLFIANDEFDALFLRQNGYQAVAVNEGWTDVWNGLLKGFDVIIFDESFVTTIKWYTEHNEFMPKSVSLIRMAEIALYEYCTNTHNGSIEELLKQKNNIDTNYIINRHLFFEIQGNLKITELDFSQGFIDDYQYYGLEAVNGRQFITSREGLISEKVLSASLLNNIFKITDPVHSNFSHDGIHKLLFTNYLPKSDDCYSTLKKFIQKYIFIENKTAYDLIAIWILGTYLFKNFDYFPYLHLKAPKGSGKSTLLDVLNNLCFNSKFYVSPTPAVIFREINLYQSTLLFDEVENFKNNASQRDVLEILNQGFSKKGTLPRVAGNSVVEYNVYSPKAFAGINEINDVLLSRSIRISLTKKPDSVSLKRFSLDDKIENELKELRDECYIFGLKFAKEIKENYKLIKSIPELDDVNNRELDNWSPIFSLAQCIIGQNSNSKLFSKLKEYLEYDRELKKETEEITEADLAKFLSEYLRKTKPIKITRASESVFDREVLFDAAKAARSVPVKSESESKFTSLLKKKFSVESKTVDVGGSKARYYTFKIEKIIVKLAEYGIKISKSDFAK